MSAPAIPTSSGVPAYVLVTGPEQLLAERAVTATLEALRAADPGVEVIRIAAEGYQAGAAIQHASPSLFGGSKALVVHDLDIAGEELQADVLSLVVRPPDEVTLIVLHKGGQRGKKVLDALKKAKARVLEAPAIKSDRDKTDFVVNEFRRQGRRIGPDGVRALIEAVGKDVTELASACSQLVADTTGVVDESVVETYHGGKVEATGFRVADAAVAGHSTEALRLLRHAFATGVDPVPIVAVLAGQLRQLVKVAGAGRGQSAGLASALGMAPWQIDKARRLLSGWDDEGLGRAILAVAAADFDVKGGGRDPHYAVERAVLAVAGARPGSSGR